MNRRRAATAFVLEAIRFLRDELAPAEKFQDLRGEGSNAKRMKWEAATNAYQLELGETYDDWADELAKKLANAESTADRERITDVALAALVVLLADLGEEHILEGYDLGLDETDMDEGLFTEARRAINKNRDAIAIGLIPAIRQKLRRIYRDPVYLAGGSVAILGLLEAARSRVEQYAGAEWQAIMRGVGEVSKQQDDQRIYWKIDPDAQHCPDCLQWGETEYPSWEDMLAETGGAFPGSGVQCDGNCRCELLMASAGGWQRPYLS